MNLPGLTSLDVAVSTKRGVPWWGSALLGLCAGLLSVGAWAQSAIYRCGNEYTNSPTPEQKRSCKLIEGGGVTVVPAVKPRPNGKPVADNGQQPKVDPQQQKARDNDARTILEAELKRAEAKLAELQKEYNNGQPEKRGEELRNVARYQERVSDLKAGVARAEADVAGLRRELQRLAPAAAR